jgi:hypothetical protein
MQIKNTKGIQILHTQIPTKQKVLRRNYRGGAIDEINK